MIRHLMDWLRALHLFVESPYDGQWASYSLVPAQYGLASCTNHDNHTSRIRSYRPTKEGLQP